MYNHLHGVCVCECIIVMYTYVYLVFVHGVCVRMQVHMYTYVCLVFVHGVYVCTQVCIFVYICCLFVYVYFLRVILCTMQGCVLYCGGYVCTQFVHLDYSVMCTHHNMCIQNLRYAFSPFMD